MVVHRKESGILNRDSDYKELLVGCGHRIHKDFGPKDRQHWTNLTTLDINPDCNPDVVWDLNDFPYPFNDDEFDEIHAYDVLEHCGIQGDYKFFFEQFTEFWRIIKHGCLFCVSVPKWDGMWGFGDPGHTRVLPPGCFTYLSQAKYKQLGETKMTDYRNIYHANFEIIKQELIDNLALHIYLVAIKEK